MLVIIILCLTFTSGSFHAATILVPDEYPTIQAGIYAAGWGDTVAVSAGTYTGPDNKDLDFNGKDIVLEKRGLFLPVVIDCEGYGRGFEFDSGESPAAVIRGITVVNGYVPYVGEGGGAEFDWGASPTLIDCDITGCDAYVGGGIYLRNGASPHLTGCNISGNTSRAYTGGIHCCGGCQPVFENCIISDNTSGDLQAGGITLEHGGVTMSDCSITGNSGYSGALYFDNSDGTITGCTISGNYGRYGGGIYGFESAVEFTDCTISANSAEERGGGAYFSYGAPAFIRCDIRENAVLFENLDSGGGGIYISNSSPLLDQCVVSSNSSPVSGGGIEFWSCSGGAVTGSFISGNSAHLGGGVYCEADTALHFYSCRFLNNSVVTSGVVGGKGGGLSCKDAAGTLLTNCLAAGNTASGNGAAGGAVYLDFSDVELMNCTITDNSVFSFFGDPYGGGVYCGDSNLEITNGILWGDEPDEIHCAGSSGASVSYSDIEGGWLGLYNFDADPRFVHPSSGDYHINASSPCVDAGSGFGAPLCDFEGDFRPTGDGWDMGADEYVCDLSVVLSGYPTVIEPGQTLEFTATAVNDCGDPHSFDRADLVIEGPAALEKKLYDGNPITIPTGGDVSAPVNLFVPPAAPPGVYTITVIISRTFLWSFPIASDRFEVEVI